MALPSGESCPGKAGWKRAPAGGSPQGLGGGDGESDPSRSHQEGTAHLTWQVCSKKCCLVLLPVINYFREGSPWRNVHPAQSSCVITQSKVRCELAPLTLSLCLAGSQSAALPSCCVTLLHSLMPEACESLENLKIRVTSLWPGSDTHKHLLLGSRNSSSPCGMPNAAAHRPLLSRRTRNRFSFICSSGNK